MKLSLMVTEGVHAGQTIPCNGVSLLIGRGPQCHVRPNSPAVAERHCNLTLRGERAFLRDLDSQSGTFLNDRQLRGEIELRDGDFLRVGPLIFVIQLESGAEAHGLPPLSSETQEMPASIPEQVPHVDPETQEMPALEPEPMPAEEPTPAMIGASAPQPGLNGSRASTLRTTWTGPRRRPRPHT